MKVSEVEVNASLEISQRASAIADDISEFRKFKKNIRESGMTTNVAIGQILPTIIMTGDFDDSMSQGINIVEKMQSNASSRRASLPSQITKRSLPSQDLYILEKDEIHTIGRCLQMSKNAQIDSTQHRIIQ